MHERFIHLFLNWLCTIKHKLKPLTVLKILPTTFWFSPKLLEVAVYYPFTSLNFHNKMDPTNAEGRNLQIFGEILRRGIGPKLWKKLFIGRKWLAIWFTSAFFYWKFNNWIRTFSDTCTAHTRTRTRSIETEIIEKNLVKLELFMDELRLLQKLKLEIKNS